MRPESPESLVIHARQKIFSRERVGGIAQSISRRKNGFPNKEEMWKSHVFNPDAPSEPAQPVHGIFYAVRWG